MNSMNTTPADEIVDGSKEPPDVDSRFNDLLHRYSLHFFHTFDRDN